MICNIRTATLSAPEIQDFSTIRKKDAKNLTSMSFDFWLKNSDQRLLGTKRKDLEIAEQMTEKETGNDITLPPAPAESPRVRNVPSCSADLGHTSSQEKCNLENQHIDANWFQKHSFAWNAQCMWQISAFNLGHRSLWSHVRQGHAAKKGRRGKARVCGETALVQSSVRLLLSMVNHRFAPVSLCLLRWIQGVFWS